MTLVFVCKAYERSTVGQADPALCPLQRLNARILIDAEHQRILRRVQVKPNHISNACVALACTEMACSKTVV